jgi:hypothetical protein
MRIDNLANERVGILGKNTYGSIMKIVEYNSTSDILVQFEKGKPIHTTWQAFLKGNVKNPYDKTVYGVGFIGEGKYRPSNNRKDTHPYKTWSSMIKRCYSEKFQESNHAYKDCYVSEEWHNFQTFAKWYDENYYEIDDEVMCLDKDILVKGNKIYSPDTCMFVPEYINKLFIKNETKRSTLPIGVYFRKGRNTSYRVVLGKDYIGQYKTLEEAFEVYKTYKETLIKKVAEEYKDKIPEKLYNAMLSFEIEITD